MTNDERICELLARLGFEDPAGWRIELIRDFAQKIAEEAAAEEFGPLPGAASGVTEAASEGVRDRKPAEELAPVAERIEHWGRELIYMCREHERMAHLVNATPWFIAPMSRPLDELEVALDDQRGKR